MPNNLEAQPGIIVNAWHWLQHHLGPVDDFTRLSQEDLRVMASDLGVSEAELQDIATCDIDISAQLDPMMRAAGLDPAVVERRFRTVMHDIQVTCVRCTSRAHCARALAAGQAAAHYHEFCGNAGTFDELKLLQAGSAAG
jgi:hypothetical protein